MQNHRTTRLTSALLVGALGVLAACTNDGADTVDTLATTTPPATATTPGTATGDVGMAWSDANVVDVLTVSNQGEVDYSQIAVKQAQNAEVKEYARTMVRDHGALVDKLKGLATQLNVTPAAHDRSAELKEEIQKDITDLQGKTGKDFDAEFINEQIDMHQEMLNLLDDLDGRTTNTELKTQIAQVRPNVQAHLDLAKQIKDKHDL